MKTPRKPFKWKGRCWLAVEALRLKDFPPMYLWRYPGTNHACVEVTIREVGKRKK